MKGQPKQVRPISASDYPMDVQLIIACKIGRLDLVESLVESNLVDPSFGNNKSLECCCENGRDNIAKYLLTYPGVTFSGNSALNLATQYKHQRCIDLATTQR